MPRFSPYIARTDIHVKSNKIEGTYSPALNSCIMLRTREILANAIGVLVVDAVLLLTMLVGLLKHPHRSSTGMWKFLYQQVSIVHLSPACAGC
jgi:hypothetical protein